MVPLHLVHRRSSGGNKLISDKEKILKPVKEHFSNVLNRSSTINEEAIARLLQVTVDNTLVDPLSREDTKAMKRQDTWCRLHAG